MSSLMHGTLIDVSTGAPLRRDMIRCHELDDEAVLYDLAHHAAHFLNLTAYAIWQLCDGRRDDEQIMCEVASQFGLDLPDARSRVTLLADVRGALRELADNGLIDWSGATRVAEYDDAT